MNELGLEERLRKSMAVHTVAKHSYQAMFVLFNLALLMHSLLKETDNLML